MTVSSIIPVNNYTGNSSCKKFDFDFLIEDENELIVQHIDKNGVITKLKKNIDYSINEIGNPNGSFIIFPLEGSVYKVLTENEKISLALTLVIKQESEFKNSLYFNFNILEWTFDYVIRILQIISRKLERCLKIDEGIDKTPDEMFDIINESKKIAVNCSESALASTKIVENYLSEISSDKTEIDNKIINFGVEYQNCLQNIIAHGINNLANIDLSNLSETGLSVMNSKLDISHTNDTKPYITETYVNGKSGYRIWSDGFCEEWGSCFDENKSQRYNVTFLKTYETAPNLTIGFPGIIGDTGRWSFGIVKDSITATGFSWYGMTSSGASYGNSCIYKVSGYVAQ